MRAASALVFFDHLHQKKVIDIALRDQLGKNKSLKDHLPSWWES